MEIRRIIVSSRSLEPLVCEQLDEVIKESATTPLEEAGLRDQVAQGASRDTTQ
jgi:hypothetical protein